MSDDSDEDTQSDVPISFPRRLANNIIETWRRLTLREISGSCGDLGNLLPLLVALSRQRAIHLGPTLFATGIVHVVLGGFVWRDVPVPLQPMTAISALAIAGELTRVQVTTAGVWMGVLLILLRITDGIYWIGRFVPISVVSGLQIGVGLRVAGKGITMISSLDWWPEHAKGFDCIAVAIVCSILCLFWLRERSDSVRDGNESVDDPGQTDSASQTTNRATFCSRISANPPVGLYLFGIGITMALIQEFVSENSTSDEMKSAETNTHLFVNALGDATWDDWKSGLLEGAIPQLPLTTLNSVISVCVLANSLYAKSEDENGLRDQRPTTCNETESTDSNRPTDSDDDTHRSSDGIVCEKEETLSKRSVCFSVGIINLLACPLGCLPHCHGAGGLAGQHRLGARSGASMVFLGIIKIFTAVFVASSALLDAIPSAILGVLLLIAGHELATTGVTVLASTYFQRPNRGQGISSDTASFRQASVIAMITTMVIVGTNKTHYGAACGWISHMVYGTGFEDLWHRNSTRSTRLHQSEGPAVNDDDVQSLLD